MQPALIVAAVLIFTGLVGLIYVLRANRGEPGLAVSPAGETQRVSSALISVEAPEDQRPRARIPLGVPSTADPARMNNTRRIRRSKRSEMLERAELKAACLAILDVAAVEHPAGHAKIVARYILRSQNDERIEMMFERDDKSRANLWLAKDHTIGLLNGDIEVRSYPAADLYQVSEPGGKIAYGRHAGLKVMRDLANVDIERFTITSVGEIEVIIDHLKKR